MDIGDTYMKKTTLLIATLLSVFTICGCGSKDKTSDNETFDSSYEPFNSENTGVSVVSNDDTTSVNPDLEEAETIGKRVKAEEGGKFTKKDNDDFDIEKEYSLSYLGAGVFNIKSSLKNTADNELYRSSTTFEWKKIKNYGIDGDIEIGSSEILRCQININYGAFPNIEEKDHTITENTLKPTRNVSTLVKTLIDLQKDGFKEANNYLKSISSSYSLW